MIFSIEKHKKYPGFYYELLIKYGVSQDVKTYFLKLQSNRWTYEDDLEYYMNYAWLYFDGKLRRFENEIQTYVDGRIKINLEVFERNPDYIVIIKNPHCSMQFIKMPKVIEDLLSFEQYDCSIKYGPH